MVAKFSVVSSIFKLSLLTNLLVSSAGYSQELGTLFYSPAERVDILQSRQNGTGPKDISVIQRYSGIVKRENGNHMVWINSTPQSQEMAANIQVKGTQILMSGNLLKVGDSLDTVSGTSKEILTQDGVKVEKTKK